MTSIQPYRVSGGKLIAAILLALVFGALSPLITVLEMSMLMPVILFGGVFMVFLYCFAGRLPACVFMIAQLASTTLVLNTSFMWMMLFAGTLPAIFVMRGIAFKRPFFAQLKQGIAAYAAGLVIAIFIAYLTYGGNMIGRMVDALRGQFEQMPDELFAPFVEAFNAAIASSGLIGAGPVTVDTYRSQISGVLSLLGETYEQTLPGTLLTGALLSGTLSVLWGNWLLARRGLATNESYISLERWFLPSQVTLGLMLMWIVSYILSETGYAAGEAVYVTVYNILSAAFLIQALAAADRFFYRRGNAVSRRRTFIIVLLVFGVIFRLFNLALFAIGAVSALFGSHGALRSMMNRRNNDHTDPDDPQQ